MLRKASINDSDVLDYIISLKIFYDNSDLDNLLKKLAGFKHMAAQTTSGELAIFREMGRR